MKIKQILFATLCIICSSCNNEYDDTFEFKSEFNSGYNTRSLNNSEENTHPLIEGLPNQDGRLHQKTMGQNYMVL